VKTNEEEFSMGLLWDNDPKNETTRTLWTWGIAGSKNDSRRWSKMSKKEQAEERASWATPQHRSWLADRSRNLAEEFEGLPRTHDQVLNGMGPFGRFKINSDTLRVKKRKNPAVFNAMSEALGRQWTRNMRKR
jgi:hypothetical protein